LANGSVLIWGFGLVVDGHSPLIGVSKAWSPSNRHLRSVDLSQTLLLSPPLVSFQVRCISGRSGKYLLHSQPLSRASATIAALTASKGDLIAP
jgi:hypothetical protein